MPPPGTLTKEAKAGMAEDLSHGEKQRVIIDAIKKEMKAGRGGATMRDINRALRSSTPTEIDTAIQSLKRREEIVPAKVKGKRGPAVDGYTLAEDDEDDV